MCDKHIPSNVMLSLILWGYHSSNYIFDCSAVSSSQFLFAGHQGSSHSDLCANTGFGSFKLPTCGWLQKGRSHSHMYMESS